MRFLLAAVCLALALLPAGCEESGGGGADDVVTGTDGGPAAATDSGAGEDATPADGGVDSGADASSADAGDGSYPSDASELSDAGPADAADDSGADAGFDAGMDAEADTGEDSGEDAGLDAGLDAGTDGGLACTLASSGPVAVKKNGQVVENLLITASGKPGISVSGYSGVVIRNCEIHHTGAAGISFDNADGITIENVSIVNDGAPASGANSSDEWNNVTGSSSSNVRIRRARLARGSSGVYLLSCPGAALSFVEGHDFRGPLPRGQLVQFDKCSGAVLADFSVVNPRGSWPEDNVNVYKSTGVSVLRGHIDGNNSPSGVGVIFDGDTASGLVEDVDAIRMGNGCFSAYAGADGSIFRRTRCRENICTSQEGRGAPSSGGLMWCGREGLTKLRIEESKYFKPCNAGNIVWPEESFAVVDLAKTDFVINEPLSLHFCWE